MGEEHDENNPRRILDVDVQEVSLVDRAANLRRFLVIKRLTKEEDDMGGFEAEVDELLKNEGGVFKATFEGIAEIVKALDGVEGESGAFWESDHETIVKALSADLSKAIGEVSTLMKRLSKMKGAPGPAIARVSTFLGKVVGGKYPSPKPVTKADEIPTEEEAKKAITEEMSKAIKSVMEFMAKVANGKLPIPEADKDEVAKEVPANLVAAIKSIVGFLNKAVSGQYPWEKPGTAEAKPVATQKSDEVDNPAAAAAAAAEIPAVQIMDDGTVVVKGDTVSKGKKFTPTRTSAIKDVALSLIKLLGEVGDDSTNKALGDALKAITGSEAAPAPAAAVATQKSADPDPAVVELKKQLAEVNEKLEKVLKERPAPAPTEDEVAKAAELKKAEGEGGLWNNIITTN